MLFTDEQIAQMTETVGRLLDQKLDKYIKNVEKRFVAIESEADQLKKENVKLKTRLCILETHARKTQAEVVGIPLEPWLDPVNMVIQLAKSAGIDLKPDHLSTAMRTGPIKETNGLKCQDITVDFERAMNCDVFLKKIGDLRTRRQGLNATMVSSTMQEAPIAVFRKISSELKRLKWLAKQKAKSLNYEFCWISASGKLCMKKTQSSRAIAISCEEDLLEIK